MNDTLNQALELAQRGYHLFPLAAGGKNPAVTGNWLNAASRDPSVLQRWFARANSNIAIACEPSGIFVIDLDTATSGAAGPAHGLETLRELADGRDLPRTLTVATPSGGTHLYYRQPADGSPLRNSVRRLGPLIDTRGVGGYLVAPGSQIGGTAYRITDDVPLAEVPDWITSLLRPPELGKEQVRVTRQVPAAIGSPYARAVLGRETARVAASKPGHRNHTLNQAAYSLGRLVADGLLDRAQVEDQLGRAAHAAGLSHAETEATLASGITAGLERRRDHGTTVPSTPEGPARADRFEWATAAGSQPTSVAAELPASQPDRAGLPPKSLAALHAAFDALELELGAPLPGPTPQQPTRPEQELDSVRGLSAENSGDLLDQAATAIRNVEPRTAALARTPEWHRIRTIGHAAADLAHQIRQAARDHADDLRADIYIDGAIRTIAARACHQIGELASAAADRLAYRGLTDSPTYGNLRAVHRVAQRAEAKLTGRTPGQAEPEEHAAARKQLKQLRRDLRAKPRGHEPTQAPKIAMRVAASRPQQHRH
jgi:Bifunctional DNA primase/polymerase, N-terminal